jgi:iron complex transport system substrate-binding protein
MVAALAAVAALCAGLGAAPGAAPRAAAQTAAAAAPAPPLPAAAPRRVVSINLCTDQLAMLLAAPGQLVSVSHLAADPRLSAMAAEAARWPANRGLAEQVFLLRPDLVLAGTFTARHSVSLLRRLGVPVLELPPAGSLDDVAAQLRAVGAALGRRDAAEAEVRAFEAGLARLRAPGGTPAAGPAPAAALYAAGGYSAGAGTLADDVLRAAGLRNIAGAAGLAGGGYLPLERLVMAAPDLIVTAQPYAGASRAEAILAHPALSAMRAQAGQASTGADWICGTPHLLRAVESMVAARAAIGSAAE